jgi:nucleoside-diphosphate-sugar epimerase
MEREPEVPDRPKIIVTGASGIIGRNFLEMVGDQYYVYAMARRSPREVGVVLRPNIRWVPIDLAEEANVDAAIRKILDWGGADYVLHLAGHYDFTNEDHPEYERSNVTGTRNLLESLRQLQLSHFVYVSTLTVSRFPERGRCLDENSETNADFPYANSKIKAENLVREYSQHYRCSIVRPAAVFSDWCEYSPLFHFLSAWLGRGWKRRVLAGRGESAVPYIHVNDLSAFLLTLFGTSDRLPSNAVYIASPDTCVSHNELYEIAKRYSEGEVDAPIYLPKWLCAIGAWLGLVVGRMVGNAPFERPWMIAYVDKTMRIDASKTREALSWQPTGRLDIRRRLLFLIENMKSHPFEWKRKNDEASHRTVPERMNFKIYQKMVTLKNEIIDTIVDELRHPSHRQAPLLRAIDRDKLVDSIELLYRGLEIAVRIGDRGRILSYAHDLKKVAYLHKHYSLEAAQLILESMARNCERVLCECPELEGMKSRVHDLVTLTFQLVGDEIEEDFDEARSFVYR